MSREGQPGDIRGIVGQESTTIIRAGTIRDVGRNFLTVQMSGSAQLAQVIIPDQIMFSQLDVGKRVVCLKADRLSPWVVISTFGQPDRYSRLAKPSAGHVLDHAQDGDDPFIFISDDEPSSAAPGFLWLDTS